MSKIISLYGLPASGKTTQADLLVAEFGFVQFGMGDRLRAEIGSGSELGMKIKTYVDDGVLIPDELMSEVIKSVGAEIRDKGIVFDGFPRILSQAEMLRKLTSDLGMGTDAFIYLKISPEEALKRIEARCEISGRSDDKDASAIRNRMDVFRKESASLMDYYRSQGKLFEIDGEKSIEEVHEDIKKCIK